MMISLSCIPSSVREKAALKLMRKLTDKQLQSLDINDDTREDAIRVLSNIIGAWAGIEGNLEEREKRLYDTDHIMSHIEDYILKVQIPFEDYDRAKQLYNRYIEEQIENSNQSHKIANIGKLGLWEADIEDYDSREEYEKAVLKVKTTAAIYSPILYIQDISRDSDHFALTVIPREPIQSEEAQQQQVVLRALDRIKEASKGFSYQKNWRGWEITDGKNKKIVRSRKELNASKKEGWIRTGFNEYSYDGRTFLARGVRNDVIEGVDDKAYPVLSGHIGTQVDTIGRYFFDKTSDLWDKQTGNLKTDDKTLKSLIQNELHNTFTVEGLRNLLMDFEKLENDFIEKWGEGIKVYSGEVMLFGETDEENRFVSGKPDLIVIDARGMTHVIDMKTRKMNLTEGYSEVLDSERKTDYQEQISRYIRMLQAYGLNVEEQPYAVLIDTWYCSADYGEDENTKSEDRRTVYRETGDESFVILDNIEENESGREVYLNQYIANTGANRETVLADTMNAQHVLYIEPRLHLRTEEGKPFSGELEALRGEGELEMNISLSYTAQFNALDEESAKLLKEMGGEPIVRATPESIIKYDKTDIESNPELISPQEISSIANHLMYCFSDLCDWISKDGPVEWERLGKDKALLLGKTHEKIIEELGVSQLLEYVFEDYIKSEYDEDFPLYTEDSYIKEAGSLNSPIKTKRGRVKFPNWDGYQISKKRNEKAKWLIDPKHKDQLYLAGEAKLRALERSVIPRKTNPKDFNPKVPAVEMPKLPGEIETDKGDNEATEELTEQYKEGLTNLEAWMLGQRHFSPKASLAQEIKRILESIILVDENGHNVLDEYGWGFLEHLDATKATQAIADVVQYCETFKEMEYAMKRAAVGGNRWMLEVLDKIESEDDDWGTLKKKFFRHFRKDTLTYSVCKYTSGKNGEKILVTQIINRKSAVEVLTQSLGAEFYNGSVGEFSIEGSEKKEPILTFGEGGKLEFTRLDTGRGTVAGLVKSKARELKEKITDVSRIPFSKKDSDEEYEEFFVRELESRGLIKEIRNVLNGIGVMVNEKIIKNTILKKAKGEKTNNAQWLLDKTIAVLTELEAEDKNEGIKPTLRSGVYRFYIDMLRGLAHAVQEHVETSVYNNGKTYYAFTNPSRLGHIIRRLSDAIGSDSPDDYEQTDFQKYIDDNFGKYTGWFRTNGEDSVWLNDWLAQIAKPLTIGEPTNRARQALAHKVEIDFSGEQYKDMGSLTFQLSILRNYFGTEEDEAIDKRCRWFAVPTMSNKPTNEFIRMLKYNNHDQIVKKVLMNTFKQEMNRIADVLYHYINHEVQADQMDLTDDKLKGWTKDEIEGLKDRINNKKVTKEDLIKLSRITSGAKFHFLWYMNNAILENAELGDKIAEQINALLTPGNESYDASLLKSVETTVRENMESIVDKEMDRLASLGLFDYKEEKLGNKNTRKVLKYQKMFNGKLGKDNDLDSMKKEVRDFIWQDIAANINIIQITGGDLAYYGNSVNYQKRIAMMHSPGLHLMHDERFDDGFLRSVHISDREAASEAKRVTEIALEGYLKNNMANRSAQDKEEYRKMISVIVSGMDKINVTDGQSFSCFTSMRKKLICMGQWDDTREKAYNAVINGNFDIEHLGVLIQPLKPFVASDVAKFSGSPTMTLRKTPLQDKNSEYLIILAQALAKGAGVRSKLVAINDFMERSAVEFGDGKRQGIDTVHFASVGKVGLTGIIDVDEFDKEYEGSDNDYNEELTEYLLGKVRRQPEEGNERKEKYLNDEEEIAGNILKPEERIYNTQYVDTIPLDDYIIQQEVPSHFFGREQLYGSQIRILGISDISEGANFNVNGEKMDSKTLTDEYKNLHAKNIKYAFKEVLKEFGFEDLMDSNGNISSEAIEKLEKDQNLKNKVYEKMAELFRRELSMDEKYGLDYYRACTLRRDEQGNVIDFTVPLLDPTQSKRIQMLLNSVIKKRINKQTITGGSLVQTTAYDKDLRIRFKREDGTIIEETLEDFNGDVEAYKKYLSDNHASIAHFECYAPVPNEMLERLMTAEGRIMTFEEAKKAFKGQSELWEQLTTFIGYRIPTEDKYSMLPLKIVGFVPKTAGQVIIMPKEITYLTGSDFDIDKMYVMRRNFGTINSMRLDMGNWMADKLGKYRGSLEGIDEGDIQQVLSNLYERMNRGTEVQMLDNTKAIGQSKERLRDFANWARNEMFKDVFELPSDKKGFTPDERRHARNNRILDLQWAVLTNEDTMSKMLNPGNFDEQKKVGRFIRILKSKVVKERTVNDDGDEEVKFWTWESLSAEYDYRLKRDGLKKTLEYLDSLLENEDPHNVTLPSSKIYFQKQNMQGSQMVGIFANNNVSHAFMTFQRVGIDLGKNGEDRSFYFDGMRIGDHDRPTLLDPMQGFNGQLVSKRIASFLAASVDTAKDPVLNDLNVNTFTGNVAMVLARLGFDTEAIGLFLSQPIIVDLSELYFKRKSEGYCTADTVIEEMLTSLGIDKKELNTKGIADSRTITKDNLIDHINDDSYSEDKADNEESKEYQINVLKAFNSLTQIARDLQDLTFCTKFNSVSNAVGPTIADTEEDLDKVRRFMARMDTNCFFVDTESNTEFTDPRNIIDSDPILKAFFDTTVNDRGASDIIFRSFFPHYFPGFKNVKDYFQKTYLKNGKLTSKMHNQLLDAYMYYLLTYRDEENGFLPVIPSDGAQKKILVEDLVKDFLRIQKLESKRTQKNMILDQDLGNNCLRVRKADEYLTVDTLLFNSSHLNADNQEQIKLAWSALMQMNDPGLTRKENEMIRRFGIDLFFYSLMRNGFTFSPKTMMHLASTLTKMNALFEDGTYTSYLEGLRNIRNIDNYLCGVSIDNYNIERFCEQFVRNHANSSSLVPNTESTDPLIVENETREENGEEKNTAIILGVTPKERYKLDKFMLSDDNPRHFITITRKTSSGKLIRELYKLDTYDHEAIYEEDGQVRIKYNKTSPLGMVNNFVEYDANSDLEDSYFSYIATMSEEGVQDEDDTEGTTKDNSSFENEALEYDEERSEKDNFMHRIRSVEGPHLTTENGILKKGEASKKAKSIRLKLYEAFKNAEKGSALAQAFEKLLNENAQTAERQQAMDEIYQLTKIACN